MAPGYQPQEEKVNKMPYEWKIAIRFLKDGRTQTFFILLGIAAGVAVQIFLNSIIVGVQENIIGETVGNSPHITMLNKVQSDPDSEAGPGSIKNKQYINLPPKNEKISGYAQIMDRMDKEAEITAVSPSVVGNAFLSRGDRTTTLLIKGIEFQRADKIYNIKQRIISGNTDLGANKILIGKDFAQEYSADPGDVITLTLPNAARENFIIEGIFDLQSAGLNSSWVFMDMGRAQKLYDLKGYVNSIELQIMDPFAADAQGERLKQIFPELKIENWKQQNAQLLSALNSQSSSSYTIQAFVLIAIALGIASVLAVSVVQKSKQIGILKAMGVTGKSASKIFVIQGGVMGFLGATAGIVMGALLIKAFIAGTSGSGGLGFEITIKAANMALVLCVSTVAGIISSLIPARNSAKLNPMEVIRNG